MQYEKGKNFTCYKTCFFVNVFQILQRKGKKFRKYHVTNQSLSVSSWRMVKIYTK